MAWPSTSFLLILVLALAGSDELITRNVIVALVPLIVLVAGGLGARRAGWLGVAGAVVLCAVGITAAVAVEVDRTSSAARPGANSPACSTVNRPPGTRSAILMENYYPGIEPLAVYLPGLHFVRPRGVRVNEVDLIAAGKVPHSYFCWWGSACNVVPARLDTTIRVPGFRRVGPVLHAGQFSVLRLRAAGRAPGDPADRRGARCAGSDCDCSSSRSSRRLRADADAGPHAAVPALGRATA